VIGTATGEGIERAQALGAHEAFDRASARFDDVVGAVDLVFDTVGGDTLARSPEAVREGGRLVSVAEEPPPVAEERIEAVYFVVEPSRSQLLELATLIDEGLVRPAIDSVFPLTDARRAFERLMGHTKQGKIVLRVADD
jgi:NADPH:quinone reductase-like Zn-dependent oxidoreductase